MVMHIIKQMLLFVAFLLLVIIYIFMRMGLPQVLTSDQGGEFVNKLNDELMKSVLCGQSCNFRVESQEFVQILHNGKKHWMTVSTIGAKHPKVLAYDSMLSHAPDRLQQQIATLLKTEETAIDVKFCKVAMQTNGCDCGVYAIAYATALCLGASPS